MIYLFLILSLFFGTVAGAIARPHSEPDHRYEPIDRGADRFWRPAKHQEVDADSQTDLDRDRDGKDDDQRKDESRSDQVFSNENRFDGSQFARSSFIDLEFHKETFRDLPDSPHVGVTKPDFDLHISEIADGARGRDQKHGSVTADRHEQDQHKEVKIFNDEFRKLGTPDYRFRDSVPDKIDPVSSGGFGTSPDNGAPVPYTLNGHVDIERGRPWEIKD